MRSVSLPNAIQPRRSPAAENHQGLAGRSPGRNMASPGWRHHAGGNGALPGRGRRRVWFGIVAFSAGFLRGGSRQTGTIVRVCLPVDGGSSIRGALTGNMNKPHWHRLLEFTGSIWLPTKMAKTYSCDPGRKSPGNAWNAVAGIKRTKGGH